MNLFIDTTNWKIIYILESKNKIIDFLVIEHAIKSANIAISNLKTFLAQNQLSIRQINNFYLTTGPGSYTGIRVGMTIVKTIKTINSNVKVWLISSLLYQLGLKKGISLLDARGNKFYCAVYDNGKLLVEQKPILEMNLEKELANYLALGYKIYQDYNGIDYVKNYLDLKPKFKLLDNVEEIQPTYIKGFV